MKDINSLMHDIITLSVDMISRMDELSKTKEFSKRRME